MRSLFLIGIAALSILGGCCNGNCGGDNNGVSSTNTTDVVNGSTEPVLPPYKPWWAD